MDGIHDVGGMDGFGSLPPDEPEDAPTFHDRWEGRVYALFVAGLAADAFTLDEFRHAVERLPPAFYLDATYYERWLAAIEDLLTGAEVVDGDDLAETVAAFEAGEASVPETDRPSLAEIEAGRAESYDTGGGSAEPAFAAGDAVRVRKRHPEGHTRCPRYVRGVVGEVAASRGTHVYPDANAHGELRHEPLYNVRFDAADLWGEAETDADGVRIELWEPYLEGADE